LFKKSIALSNKVNTPKWAADRWRMRIMFVQKFPALITPWSHKAQKVLRDVASDIVLHWWVVACVGMVLEPGPRGNVVSLAIMRIYSLFQLDI
jgi:hypothetical protein